MRKPVIPQVKPADPQRYLFDQTVRQTLEQLTGVLGGPLAPLADTATTAEIIAKVNEIIARLNR